MGVRAQHAEAVLVPPADTPPVRCSACSYSWNSAGMVDGLRLIGSCPKCGERALVFRDVPAAATPPVPGPGSTAPSAGDGRAPHLVLGVPRR